jgi:hypothetical protein
MSEELDERLDAIEAEAREEQGRAWQPAKILFFLGILIVGAGWWFFVRGHDPASDLPIALVKPASGARDDLAALCRGLLELAGDASNARKHTPEKAAKKAGGLVTRWTKLHKQGRTLEPQLTREEQRVLVSVQWGEKLLKEELDALATRTSGKPQHLTAAQRQFENARDLLAGRKVDDMIAGYAQKLLASTATGRQLEQITTGLEAIKASNATSKASLDAALRDAEPLRPRR